MRLICSMAILFLPALIQVKTAVGLISKMVNYLPEARDLTQRFESLYVDLKEIAQEVAWIEEKIESDPERIRLINDRLDLIYSLQQKHHVQTVKELIDIRDYFELKIRTVSSNEEELLLLSKLKELKYKEVLSVARSLSDGRRLVAKDIELQVSNQLILLGMPNLSLRLKYLLKILLEPMAWIVLVSFLLRIIGILYEISKVASRVSFQD